MENFKAITTVYSYYLPEIRKLIDELVRDYPHDIFLQSVKPGLDDFHVPIIEKLIKFYQNDLLALGQFNFKYPTAGSEEFIREYMTLLQSQGIGEIYMLKGDYEGYKEVAKTRNISVREVDFESNPKKLKPGYWFLSNPSARNGMIIKNDIVKNICEAGHKIFYDLSYLGATDHYTYDTSHTNIDAVAISFSKPFGLFYYRIGFAFSRRAIPALYANKWFKNIFGLLIAKKLLTEINPAALIQKYKKIQAEIIDDINRNHGLDLKASDAFLLAYLPKKNTEKLNKEQQEMIKKFQRNDYYRFCLTPYFQEWEK